MVCRCTRVLKTDVPLCRTHHPTDLNPRVRQTFSCLPTSASNPFWQCRPRHILKINHYYGERSQTCKHPSWMIALGTTKKSSPQVLSSDHLKFSSITLDRVIGVIHQFFILARVTLLLFLFTNLPLGPRDPTPPIATPHLGTSRLHLYPRPSQDSVALPDVRAF